MATPVRVYVRKGADNNERRISFQIPPTMSKLDLLNRGVALDGRDATFTIWARSEVVEPDIYSAESALKALHQSPVLQWSYGGPFFNESSEGAATFTEALAIAQRELVRFLIEHDCEPLFE